MELSPNSTSEKIAFPRKITNLNHFHHFKIQVIAQLGNSHTSCYCISPSYNLSVNQQNAMESLAHPLENEDFKIVAFSSPDIVTDTLPLTASYVNVPFIMRLFQMAWPSSSIPATLAIHVKCNKRAVSVILDEPKNTSRRDHSNSLKTIHVFSGVEGSKLELLSPFESLSKSLIIAILCCVTSPVTWAGFDGMALNGIFTSI